MCPAVSFDTQCFAHPACSRDFPLSDEKLQELRTVAVLGKDVLRQFELSEDVITVEERDWILANQIEHTLLCPLVAHTPRKAGITEWLTNEQRVHIHACAPCS